MKREFRLIEVMLANTILVILVAGFSDVTEKTLEQMQVRQQILNWLRNTITGLYQN